MINLKALAFDVYSTLFDTQSVVSECEAAFPGQGERLSRLWRVKQLQRTRWCVLSGRYNDLWHIMDDALLSACRDMRLSCSKELREHLRNQYLCLKDFPEVAAALRALGERYMLAILSNGTASMITATIGHRGLTGAFAAILSADSVRTFKPHPRVYELAERTLKLPRAQIGYVSANPFDMAGAKGFGLSTIWLHRETGPSRLMGLMSDISISNLSELVSLLRK